MTRRGIVDFLRPAQARLPIRQSVSPKLYATKNPGGEIGPGIRMECPSKDHDAFDRTPVPPPGLAILDRLARMVFNRGRRGCLIRGTGFITLCRKPRLQGEPSGREWPR